VGHLSRDCKKKQTVRPPRIVSHNVQFDFDVLEKNVDEAVEVEVKMRKLQF
jgi:hypothetical protein